MNLDSHIAAIRSDVDRIAVCAEQHRLNAPVAACPGWDVDALIRHVGGVHRWATQAIESGGVPAVVDVPRPEAGAPGAELAAWMRDGATGLTDALAATPPDADSWHPFPAEQKAWVWSRRQAQETMMHRWDAETATIGSSDLDAEMAADGIQEYFELGVPRILERGQLPTPTQSLHVHCTDEGLPDGAGEWIAWNEAGEYRMETVHRKGDAALRGSAEQVLLVLMGRADRDTLDTVGDPQAAAAWLDLPGW